MSKKGGIKFIEQYWDKDIELEIITGNSIPMKKIVIDILNEYKLEYRIGNVLGTQTSYIVVFMGR